MTTKKNLANESVSIKLLRRLISEMLLAEDETPGGELTDFGAEAHLNPANAVKKFNQAIETAEGDVESAAKTLGIAPSTVYFYNSKKGPLKAAQGAVERAQSGQYAAKKEKEVQKRRKENLKDAEKSDKSGQEA